MKLYIPEIGDQLILSKDWSFDLYSEYRNKTLLTKINKKFNYNDFENQKVTLCAGTILKVDRIYIRKGNSEYSSLTFYIGNGEWKGARFWAKLSDVNTIEFDNAEIKPNIKVSFSRSIIRSETDKIVSHDYINFWKRNYASDIIASVNGKPIIKIKIGYIARPLTSEECTLLNKSRYDKYSTEDVMISDYKLTAYLISSGEYIGTASTTSTLSKKIKEYLTK